MKTGNFFNYLLIFTFLISSLLFATPVKAAAGSYHLKVNRYTNTVTVYQKQTDGSEKPIRVMLCSTGGNLTPLGTFKTPVKYRWKVLMGNVWGQYSTRIVDHVLFHSVPYYKLDPGTLMRGQFERLGSAASHGCVRLSAVDAKWIYENCALGTPVTVYSSPNPGPLGKPKPVSYPSYTGYDPTDTWSPGRPKTPVVSAATPAAVAPIPTAPAVKVPAASPKITVPKQIVLSKNNFSYDLLKGVKAISSDGKDITNDIEIEDNIDFETPGKYTVKYSVTDKNGHSAAAKVTAILK